MFEDFNMIYQDLIYFSCILIRKLFLDLPKCGIKELVSPVSNVLWFT